MPNKGTIISPTQQQIDARQQAVENKLMSQATDIPGVNDSEQADVRDLLPNEDLTTTEDNGWAQTDREFIQSGMSADSAFNAYDIDRDNEARDKIIAIYGVATVPGDPLTTAIEFQDGTGVGFYEVNTQSFDIPGFSDIILFEQDIIYGISDDGSIIQWANDDGDDAVLYLGKVIEQGGNTVTQRGQ